MKKRSDWINHSTDRDMVCKKQASCSEASQKMVKNLYSSHKLKVYQNILFNAQILNQPIIVWIYVIQVFPHGRVGESGEKWWRETTVWTAIKTGGDKSEDYFSSSRKCLRTLGNLLFLLIFPLYFISNSLKPIQKFWKTKFKKFQSSTSGARIKIRKLVVFFSLHICTHPSIDVLPNLLWPLNFRWTGILWQVKIVDDIFKEQTKKGPIQDVSGRN